MGAIFTATADGVLQLGDRSVRCALGRGGVRPAAEKQEGDGASPAGLWPIRRVIYRPDRCAPPLTALDLQAMAPDDGWCDDPGDLAYNRPVKLPYPAGAERMWMESAVYDYVVVLGHNDDPPVPSRGSAIFLHLAGADYAPTAGCVAIARADMLELLRLARPGDSLAIVA